MTDGSNCTKVDVQTPEQEYRNINAIILEGTATVINKRGDVLASMPNTHVVSFTPQNTVWENDEGIQWKLTAGCSCGGRGCV